ncbi:MAG: hypothetical protein RL560_40 [Actinomycetota bacterium]
MRDARTQSKVSTPFSMAIKKSSGAPIPSRCLGFSCGSVELTQPTIVPSESLSSAPPIPKPSNEIPDDVSAPRSDAGREIR